MGNDARVFVVDDEQILSWSAGMILSSRGFKAYTFTDPLEALKRAAVELPDLLITDVKMPEMSGIELAIQIKSLCPRCNVLLLSGFAGTGDLLDDARQRGHDFELLEKPVHPEVLLAIVNEKVTPAEKGSIRHLKQCEGKIPHAIH